MEVTREGAEIAIGRIRPGVRWSRIAAVMQHVESGGLLGRTNFVGHGIGTKTHEDRKVPNLPVRSGGRGHRAGRRDVAGCRADDQRRRRCCSDAVERTEMVTRMESSATSSIRSP